MLVSIVIPTYNEEKDIGKCLSSLKEQSYKKIEIVLVDDGSTDKTLEIVKKFKGIKVIKGEHKGTAFSRNLGAKQAKGEILVFIDADMCFDKDYIKNLVMPIVNDETGKLIGTTHDYEIATNTDNKYSYLWGKIRVSKEDAKNVKIFRAIRKDKFLELGGFDSKYGYADDQTFWFKHKIKPQVAENTTCYHKNPSSLKSTFKQARWIGASWKQRFFIFKIPIVNYFSFLMLFLLLPFLILLKSVKVWAREEVSMSDLLNYYWYKFYGYLFGLARAVFLGRVWK